MTDKKLSQLPLGSAAGYSDLWYSDQGGVSVAQPSAIIRSFVRPQAISIDDPAYGGLVHGTVSGGQRLTNLANINAAIAAASAAGQDVDWGPYIYQVDGTIVMPPGPNNFVPMMRGVFKITRIEEWNSAGGIDTVHYGGAVGAGANAEGGGLDGFTIVSMIDQSATTPLTGNLGAQLSISNGVGARFSRIKIGEINAPVSSHTHYAYNGICFDPANGPFNCLFADIEIKGYGQCGANMQQSTSGNFIWNLIIRNGGLGESPLKTSNGPALIVGNGEGTLEQVNIEWSIFGNGQPAIYLPSSAGCRFGHLHMEGLQLSEAFAGSRRCFILVPGESMSRFESLHMISTNLPTGCNIVSAGVFGFGFSAPNSDVSVGQILISQTATLGTGVNFYFVNSAEGVGAGTVDNCRVDFVGPYLAFGDGSFASKLTGWSDVNLSSTARGPANGLGVPPSNFIGSNTLTITTSTPGYSAGTYTQTNADGNSTYLWTAAVNGTILMSQIVDQLKPVSTAAFPGMCRRVINGSAANTLAVHNNDTTNIITAASLSAGQWVDLTFNGVTGKWVEIGAGTLL